MRKITTSTIAGLLAGSLLLPGCATLISGSRQGVRVAGHPAGSTFYVNEREVKARPVSSAPGTVKLRLSRRTSSQLTVKHDGYKDYNQVLTATKTNPAVYLDYATIPLAFIGVFGALIDYSTGAARRFEQSSLTIGMQQLPRAVAGGPTVQAGTVNVRVKGGDKMGNFFIAREPSEILYFGKTLDVNAEHLQSNVNSSLKDLGYNVPGTQSRSLFAASTGARYTLQGEMRNVTYNINASNQYEAYNRYTTDCQVEVTWKLLNQGRQTVVEQKTTGTSVKFEKGGSAAFEDAFENALYNFLARPEVAALLAKPGAPAAEAKAAPLTLHRPAPAKLTGDNGVGAAAKAVVTIETADGHGSGCLVSADGYVVTNAHVVGDDSEVKVLLPDGLSAKGKVVRVNSEMDLALVKIDAENLPAFQLPLAAAAEVGADVYAIGTPADKELGQSVSKGIISGKRKLEGHTLLQTDVSINGGNSGGALVARSGQLVGIVNAKLVGRGIEGIGFAIPAEQVAEALQLAVVD